MKRKFILVTKYLLALLFAYAGIYKIVDVSLFRSQLYQSPLLPAYLIPAIAIVLPLSELTLAALLLFVKKLEYSLLWISFGIMLFFSVYLIMLFTLYDKPPCSCGGILAGMTYPVHITFNLTFTILSIIAVYLHENFKPQNTSVNSALLVDTGNN